MASTRKLNTKDGIPFYEISVSRGRGVPRITTRWYPPAGWSQKAIDRELVKVAVEFEQKVKAGEVLTRQEERIESYRKELEAAQIKTLKQYGETVYMPSLTIHCSENTRTSYQGNLNKWIYPVLGDFKLPEVTAAQIIALLRELRLEQSKKAISQYVFTQEGSPEPIHPQSPARYLQNFANGVQDLHPHKLRHSFASIAITNGADIASVSEKLGHTDKAVTLRMYTHADQESIRRASQIFRNAIKEA